MILDCTIIDDEPLARKLLESYVEKTSFLNLKGSYGSAVEAIHQLVQEPVQLIFLDIQMPDLNGMEFARMLPHSTKIIFTTAFPDYAVEGFRVNALDYLLKPIDYSQFLEAANKALNWHQTRDDNKSATNEPPLTGGEDFIYVKSDYKLLQIKLDEIIYIEGLKDYLKIYLEDSARPILTLVSMKSMEERLPSPRFLRVHRSYIVQMDKVKVIDKGHIVFDKMRIPISDGYKSDIQKYINEHLL